jgi:hypothetical protein
LVGEIRNSLVSHFPRGRNHWLKDLVAEGRNCYINKVDLFVSASFNLIGYRGLSAELSGSYKGSPDLGWLPQSVCLWEVEC